MPARFQKSPACRRRWSLRFGSAGEHPARPSLCPSSGQSIVNPTAGLPNVDIATYSISRIYFGSQATIQLGRNSVSFDGSWVELFDPETAPFATNSVLESRTVSGLQAHAKGTYNISLDQEKHFSGSIVSENSLSAPSRISE